MRNTPIPWTPQEERVRDRSLRDIYYVLFRHKWKVISFFLAVVITVTLGTILTPKVYQSQAKVMLRLGRENVSLDPTVTTGPIVQIGQTREYDLNSEMEILKSRDLIEKVVDAIGPTTLLNPPQEESNTLAGVIRETVAKAKQKVLAFASAVKSTTEDSSSPVSDRDSAIMTAMEGLRLEALKNSNIISITYESNSQKMSQDVITRLIAFYLDKHIAVYRPEGSYDFFDKQTEQSRKELVRAEENLREFKNKAGISSLNEQREILLKRIGDLRQEAEATRSALAASQAKILALQKTLADLPPTVVVQEISGNSNYGADTMRAKLYELQLKEQDLLSKYNDNSKPVKEVQRQIAEAQALLGKEPTRTQVTMGPNQAYQQVEMALLTEKATVSPLRAKEEVLQEQIKSALSELKVINDSESQLSKVQREITVQEANFRKYYEKLEQARIDQALEMKKISNVSIVEQPTYPIDPVRPKKMLNLALGLFVGLFGGIGLAFFSEYLDHTFKRPEDIEERLKLPTLAAIPGPRRELIGRDR